MKQQDNERQVVADAGARKTTPSEEKSDRFVSSEQQTGSDSVDWHADDTASETDPPNRSNDDHADKGDAEKRNGEERQPEGSDASAYVDKKGAIAAPLF